MEIKLKKSVYIAPLNNALEACGIRGRFVTEADNLDCLNDINVNPDSPQRHFKPAGRELTLNELVSMVPKWTEVGLFEADPYFGRTSGEEMQRIAAFIVAHQQDIAYITDADMLIERGNIEPALQPILKLLEKPKEIYEEYPAEEQARQRKLQSGQLLCKSWGVNPFWVIHGKVASPQFLKEYKYVDKTMNSLYRDNQGRGYMLLPLYDFSSGFFERVFQEAWDLGMREHSDYFLQLCYLCYPVKISDIKETAHSFYGFYTLNELKERFRYVLSRTLPHADTLNREVTWSTTGIKVNPKIFVQEQLVQLANALFLAIKMHYGALQRAFIGQAVTLDTVLTFKKGKLALKEA